MSQLSTRDKLLGMMAVSKEFVKPDELVQATTVWPPQSNAKSLLQSLVEQGSLTAAELSAVEKELDGKSESEIHDSLQAALGDNVFGALRQALDRIDEAQVADTVANSPTAHSQSSSPPELPGDGERFEIEKELARGGLGEVFIARDKQLNRDVALKQILQRWVDHSDFNERFLMEAEITGRLEHPGVVPVYALGRRDDGCYFYAMRLIGGRTLEAEIDHFFETARKQDTAQRRLELHQLLRRFVDVCNTIDYAHSRGIIHRDLKPANIMLGKYGETLVVDWGLAKHVGVGEQPITAPESLLVPGSGSGSTATQYGSAIGTPQFMSPEQAAGHIDRLGPASDIYSLGATFFHLLTNRPPQSGNSVEQLLENVQSSRFPAPRSLRADIPKPLEAICLKAMQRAEEDRYASAGAMAEDIERWLADQRVEAYEEPLLEKTARSIRRHQTAASSGAVAVVLLCVAALVGTLYWQSVQTRQREQAQALQREQVKREQEAQQRLAEKRATAQANLQFGLAEAGAGRFESALGFFQQGEEACADEPELVTQQETLFQHAQQMSRLVDFDRLSDEATLAYSYELDQRAIVLLSQALQRMAVFEHSDWWRHLPVENLPAEQADRIEKRTHVLLVMLGNVTAKLTLSPSLTEEQKQLRVMFGMARDRSQAYRYSQWVDRLEASRRMLNGQTADLPTGKWQPAGFVDNFMLGNACLLLSFSEGDNFGAAFIKRFLGTDDSLADGLAYLHAACELQPDHYLANVILGWMELRSKDYDAAIATLNYAASLRPDLSLAYTIRHQTRMEYALSLPEDEEGKRRELLQLALQDANASRDCVPQYETGYWLRGDTLRALHQPKLAVSAYLEALEREPPPEVLKLGKMSTIFSQEDPHQVRRLSFVLKNRFQQAKSYGQKLGEANPDNALYALLEAVAALELVDASKKDDLLPFSRRKFTGALDEAERTAERLSDVAGKSPTDPQVESMAWAVHGAIHRHRGDLSPARDAFSRALELDSQNTRAAIGQAGVLEELAVELQDPLLKRRALAAYQRLREIAFADWHSTLADEGRFRMLLLLDEDEPAGDLVKQIWQRDPGVDLAEMLTLAEQHNSTTVKQEIQKLQSHVQSPFQKQSSQIPRSLPLRNGHFELGLGAYWELWQATDCEADAVIVDAQHGERGKCLRVEHYSAPAEDSRGVLSQTFPATSGERYRISLWCKGEQVSPEAFTVLIDDQPKPALKIPAGSFAWQQANDEFELPSAESPGTPRNVRLQIVSTAPGTVWIDDIQIERVTTQTPAQ